MLFQSILLASAIFSGATAQYISGVEVGQDAIWHNRYHAALAMGVYGDNWQTKCPEQTFTQANLDASFPDETGAPWTLIETFGPTESGAEGYTVIIPEMDKIVLVFKGNYGIENHLDEATVNLNTALGLGTCDNCTGNAQAVQAYVEAREATNNWELAAAAVERTGHQWSVTGHGFGGMLSIIASIDLGWAGQVAWSHNYGAPLTVNQGGADLFQSLFQGEAGETGIANSDPIPYTIPESANYTRTPTLFYYQGYNETYHMNMNVCGDTQDPMCNAQAPYNETDRYFYFTPVLECGGNFDRENITQQQNFIESVSSEFYATASVDAVDVAAEATAMVSDSALPNESGVSSAMDAAITGNVLAIDTDSSASSLQGGLLISAFVGLFALLA